MSDQKPVSNRYLVDTNIVVYVLKGLKNAIEVMEKLEEDNIEVYYSTIIEAELFSFHELTEEQKVKIRSILDFDHLLNYGLQILNPFEA